MNLDSKNRKCNKIRKNGKKWISLLLVLCMCFSLPACGKEEKQESDGEATKVVLTMGFNEEEVFRISKSSCTLSEVMVYLTNMQNQYESVYGKEIWNTSIDGVTLEEKVKETVIARIAQVKTMALLAEEHGVILSEKEEAAVEAASEEYFNSLNDKEIKGMDVELETIKKLYTEFAMANRVYENIIKDVNPEISDDEARTITVRQILIKTHTTDKEGNKVEFSEARKAQAYEQAEVVYQKAVSGNDFDVLAEKYNEDKNHTYSFGKGEMEAAFEEAAFNLAKDEISEIVETSYGYHIIKCVSNFDMKETDANKEKIVKQRKKDAFNEVYNQYVAGLTRNLNNELWDSVTMIQDAEVTTADFFHVFDKHFETVE